MGNSCAKIDDDEYLKELNAKYAEALNAIREAKTPKELEEAKAREVKLHNEQERIRWKRKREAIKQANLEREREKKWFEGRKNKLELEMNSAKVKLHEARDRVADPTLSKTQQKEIQKIIRGHVEDIEKMTIEIERCVGRLDFLNDSFFYPVWIS